MKFSRNKFISIKQDELFKNTNLLNSLIECYIEVYKEWNEEYSHQQVIDILLKDLTGIYQIIIVLEQDNVIGFCWMQVLNSSTIILSLKKLNYCRNINLESLESKLDIISEGDEFIYVHDWGISKKYRNGVLAGRILAKVYKEIEVKAGTDRIICWTIKESNTYRILPRIGFIHTISYFGMEFFSTNGLSYEKY